jgi:short-subunit dehydrogenase
MVGARAKVRDSGEERMSDRPLAVITGASAGIGTAFARKLAARGYDLLLVARREDRLRGIAGEVKGLWLALDLTRDEDIDRLADRLRTAPNLAIVVNNAGFGTLGNFWEADVAGQDAMHRLHVLATMRLTHAALENLVPRAQADTGVINVSSVAAFGRAPQSVSYGATKTWMNAFTEGIWLELKSRESPVRVQALCPGFTLSEFHDVLGMDRSPIGKSLWMTTDSVVEASLRGFDQGKLFVVPGWRYKALVWLLRAMPAALLRNAASWGVRRYRRRNRESKVTSA